MSAARLGRRRLGSRRRAALARHEDDLEHRTAKPLLHRRAHRGRRDRGIASRAAWRRNRCRRHTAAPRRATTPCRQAADLLEPADLAGDIRHRRRARPRRRSGPWRYSRRCISSSRFSTSAGSTPGFTVASTSNRPMRWNGCMSARDRDRDLLVAHQDLVEPRAGQPAEHRRAEVERRQLRRRRPGTAQ